MDRASRFAHMLGRRLAGTIDRHRMSHCIIRAMATCVKAELGALAVYDRPEGALRITATHGYPLGIVEHLRLTPGEGIIGQVYSSGRSLLVSDTSSSTALPGRKRYRTASCLVVPVKSGRLVLGVVALADPIDRQYFCRSDLRAVGRLVPPVALALERERLRDDIDEIARAATRDPLTGLANRQYLNSRLEAELQRARRLQHPLAVMLVDLDDFKRVNDTWGHSEGDRLLRDASALLRDSVRIFDVCTRYGGEEFAILMPGADEAVALQIADRVRKAVESAYQDRPSGLNITLSAGVALMRRSDSPESLLDRADFALLDAKAAGKNAVRLAQP